MQALDIHKVRTFVLINTNVHVECYHVFYQNDDHGDIFHICVVFTYLNISSEGHCHGIRKSTETFDLKIYLYCRAQL